MIRIIYEPDNNIPTLNSIKTTCIEHYKNIHRVNLDMENSLSS